jgi:diaminohydroxyphosphoribosylaminopyrimidine deaminase/5-amino-6-(5-phosphoribosylamino)uracil reductase
LTSPILITDQHNLDLEMTRRAFELAARGIGLVSPSPLVGCVVVSAGGEIAGEGTYEFDGVTHAEVLALEQAGERARGATVYVSLEPHSHHGRTSPCTDALLQAGVKRVVCPIEDPNPLVSGRGFQVLRERGIEVVTGILRDEAQRLNEKFCLWHNKGRPFVHLKLAMSLDGRISLRNSVSTALSGRESAARVHQLRHENDAILVGGNTALVDDPSLTDRSGRRRRRPLVRVVLDNRLRLPAGSKLVGTVHEAPTVVITNSENEERIEELETLGVDVARADARDIDAVLGELRKRDLQSVLVEGGSAVAGAFCDADLLDKLTFIVAPFIIGGTSAPTAFGGRGASGIQDVLRVGDLSVSRLGDDLEFTGYPSR